MFDATIIFLIAFFIAARVLSLSSVEIIYVQDVHLPKTLYLALSMAVVLAFIALVYYLPTTIVLETFALVIAIRPIERRRPLLKFRPIKKPPFVMLNLHVRYQVVRC